jgi:hypothetical protein
VKVSSSPSAGGGSVSPLSLAERKSRIFLRALKASAAAVTLGLACVAVGCAGDDEEEAPQGRAQPSLVAEITVAGGSPRERGVLRAVVSGMDRTTLKRVLIGPVRGRRNSDSGGRVVPLSFTAVAGPSVRPQWDEWIVAGAFSRRLLAVGLPAEVDASSRARAFTARPVLKGQPDPRPLGRRQLNAIVKAIRAAAKQSGGEVARLEIHRPYGVAVALVMSSREPARFLKTRLRPLMTSLDRQRPRLEGLYLALLDDTRRLALEWGSWTRNPAGTYWVRHDLANCSPIEQSAPPGSEPPPDCPE